MNNETEVLHFKGAAFEVLKEQNNQVYSLIESDSHLSQRIAKDSIIDLFTGNREKFLTSEIIYFLLQTGVDYKKENEIYYTKLDDHTIISGWFDIIGRIMDKERTETMFWDNANCATNVTFVNNETHAMREEFREYKTFRMNFDLVLPEPLLT